MKRFKLVLLRHGESQWNLKERFTGWTDVDLTEKGEKEARSAGSLLCNSGFIFDIAYTSKLIRANKTMDICINEMGLSNIKKIYDWRLNERHYGALQGLNKTETAKKFGDEQVFEWRRSYVVPPPPLEITDKRHPRNDSKYSKVKSNLPGSESLKDTYERLYPLLTNNILVNIKQKKSVIIVAHGNSLRAIVKYLDNISDEEIVNLNIPTGRPLVYELDENLSAVKNYYL